MLTSGRLFGGRRHAVIMTALGSAAVLTLLGVAMTGCESSDPTAPEGSTVTVTADPQTVVVQGGVPGVSKITATVRSSNGTRLPDQEVIFETTAGLLNPPAQTSLDTDSDGQVTCTLQTSSTATVTARSGTISGTTTVQTASGNLSFISLDAFPNDISFCTETVDLEVVAEDPNGNGIPNITIKFERSTPMNRTELAGSINPTQPKTDGTGIAVAVFTPSQNFCDQNCSLASDPNAANGGACGVQIVATDITGAFRSSPVIVTESIP